MEQLPGLNGIRCGHHEQRGRLRLLQVRGKGPLHAPEVQRHPDGPAGPLLLHPGPGERRLLVGLLAAGRQEAGLLQERVPARYGLHENHERVRRHPVRDDLLRPARTALRILEAQADQYGQQAAKALRIQLLRVHQPVVHGAGPGEPAVLPLHHAGQLQGQHAARVYPREPDQAGTEEAGGQERQGHAHLRRHRLARLDGTRRI